MEETGAEIGSWAAEKKPSRRLRSVPLFVTLSAMEENIRYRGREITGEQLEFMRSLIANNPTSSRRALSKLVCEAWDWRQANGQLCDMVCRGLMLACDRAGLMKLPLQKSFPVNPLAGGRRKPPRLDIDQTPISCSVKELGPLEIRQVRRSKLEGLFGSLIEHHHYLGYTHPVGEQLKFLVYCGRRPVACFAFSSAPRHLGPRDRYIGWSAYQRRVNIHLITYNTRFLILPWIKVPHLASHLLGRIARHISSAWEALYYHPIHFLETFVDTELYKGISYQAANWVYLGLTTGRGKEDHTHRPNRSIKAIWAYPLSKDFRRHLCRGLER